MTPFFKEWGALSGDGVIFEATNRPDTFKIRVAKATNVNEVSEPSSSDYAPKVIKLRGWKAVY